MSLIIAFAFLWDFVLRLPLAIFFGNELQKFHIGKIVVCNVTCDATDVRRQEILLEENFKMLAQNANRAGHRSIEIDMQIADEKVSHAVNLYSHIMVVNRVRCDKMRGLVVKMRGFNLKMWGLGLKKRGLKVIFMDV